jgi:hypothetical protein
VSAQDDFTLGIGVATIEFARLLNEARTRLQISVDNCTQCKDGIVIFDDFPMHKGDACLDCEGDREFLAKCTKLCGPVIARPLAPSACGDSNG